ncbi:hypothetical protein AMYT_a0056 (plasmid) [Malaciobacter mytili LMG 24559]|uniref:hypothetical protein n=1 Tax=Malaciobacter mytili TaxID=603050 RepID=UPI000E100966|nr:hypothetical protein [Malaciobacter mytili]AXH16356.1 hypothetical protein AMYT_a0056 [Malaciobacter mytili LMG 24559]
MEYILGLFKINKKFNPLKVIENIESNDYLNQRTIENIEFEMNKINTFQKLLYAAKGNK